MRDRRQRQHPTSPRSEGTDTIPDAQTRSLERRQSLESLRTTAGDDWPHVSARLNPALDDAMRDGHAIAIGEWREGLNAVAAGFVGPSGQRYSVNCGGASHQCPPEWLHEHVVPALHECIAKITREIGGAPARRHAV